MEGHAKPVALQMWTVREAAQNDFVGTLKKIAQLGFTGVEQVHGLGYGGLSAAQTRAQMADLGLQTAGVHITLTEWEADTEGLIAFVKDLGATHTSVSWVEPNRRSDEAAYRQTAESIKRIAERCEQSGLTLLYHHHDFEFTRFHGQTALDLISEIVGPERLGVEVDVHWVKRGGEDPVDYLRQMGPRCSLVHFKDVAPRGLETDDHEDVLAFTPVGTGCLDFPALAVAAQYALWYIVEQDYCVGDPFEVARISLQNLKQMGLVQS